MTSHWKIAARERETKERNPDRYCTVKGCLWVTGGPNGSPCGKPGHAVKPVLLAEPTYAERHDGTDVVADPDEMMLDSESLDDRFTYDAVAGSDDQ